MRNVIIKPIITERSTKLTEKLNRYTFKVVRDANKIEIAQNVEKMYNVKVTDVNTLKVPSKTKSRMTRTGILVGRKDAYKKAIITVAKDNEINFYENV